MMRGPKRTTVCVRTAPDKIYSEDISINTIPSKCKLFKLPFLRGIAGLIDSMRLSYKALMLSADKAIESTEIEEEPSKFEKWLDDKFGDKLVKVMMVIASILGVALAVGLFFFVPSFLFDLSANVVPAFKGDGGNAVFWKSVFEGVLKIILFLLYIIVCSQMTDMKGCLCTTVPSTRQFSVTKTKKNSQLKMLKSRAVFTRDAERALWFLC